MTHEALFQRACAVIPGGVNSPVRAFNGVGGTPLYVVSGNGARIRTADGRELTDFCCSWGAMILGHAHPEVAEAVCRQASAGTTFGINTPGEVELAECLCRAVPGLERVRLVNSGTEAVMTAIRLARGVTGRKRLIKFDGCYHGHSDSMLISAGSGLLTGGTLTSLGVPRHVAEDTFVAPYNDLDAVKRILDEHGRDVAAILVEPVAANMGLVLPDPDFLMRLRRLADSCGALLIFDEVINGFRFHRSTYSAICGIQPDLYTMGKVIGGGLPLAAVGGFAVFMDNLAPLGGVYQAGTLSGNPLAVAAGLKTLEILERDAPYPGMAARADRLAATVNAAAAASGTPLRVSAYKGIFTVFCADNGMRCLADTRRCDTKLYAKLFHTALDAGFYLPPSQFEVGFVSAAHTDADVDALADVIAQFCKEAGRGRT
ncbi:MAG: glutamate-1-semialdehyde 2,1-aminomutase [Kiritimatiellae bacterium]|nr:glutamate-1-semialdehyde 2,1-aminomutase [Kiritimatiellia bacterium]